MADDDEGPVNTQGESDPIAQAGSMPDSVTVNATPDNPQIDTQTPDAGQVQAQAPQSGPTVLIPQKRGGLAGIVDEFRDAIAGTHGRGVYINPDTGERHEVTPYLSHGQQWRKIASEALTGATAGFAAGHGAGNMAKAPLAGVQAQMQAHQQQVQNQDQQAEQDYSREKQAKLAKANSQLLALETAKNQFALTRMGVQAGQEDIKFGQEQEDREKALGSADLGIYADHKALADAMPKVNPDFWKNHFDDNSVRAIPVYDADGTRKGVHFYQRQPGIGDQPVAQGTQIPIFQPAVKPGDRPTYKMVTLAGSHTENEVDAYVNSQTAKMQQWEQAQQKSEFEQSETAKNESEVPKNRAETVKNFAEAGKAGEETRQLKESELPTGPGGDVDLSKLSQSDLGIGRALSNGDIKTADLGRMSGPQKLRFMKIAQAMDPTFSTMDYDVRRKTKEDFTGSGKDAVQLQANRQFLDHAYAMSSVVNSLRNTGSPLINAPLNKLATKVAGNTDISSAIGPLLAARTEYLNFLNNNHALSQSDKDDEEKLLSLNQSPAMLQKNLKTMAHTAAARLDEANNKYVEVFHKNAPGALSANSTKALQHFGLGDFAQRLGTSNQAPAGASAEVHDQATGRLTGHVVNGKFVPVQQ